MSESEIPYEKIDEWLNQVQCPFRLYPEIVAGLDILLEQNYSTRIHEEIKSRLAGHVGIGWSDQFTTDYQTYGLLEAILYFHSFPFTGKSEGFIKDACRLYGEIATQYMAHQQEIEESDDPRLHSKISLLEFRGSLYRNPMQFQKEPLKKTKFIEAAAQPPAEPGYQRKLPINRDMLLAFTEGEIGDPENAAEEAIEHLDARFTFSDFPGIQLVMSEIAKLLGQLKIEPFSAAGQYVFQVIIEHMEEEFYGDFDRWVRCFKCGEELMPEITLDSANLNLLNGGWACEECQAQLDQN